MTRAAVGQISLAAATNNVYRAYLPDEEVFFGAFGVQVAASISQLFYLPDLPGSGVTMLQAAARVSAAHTGEAVKATTRGSYSGAAVYGFLTVTLQEGISFGGAAWVPKQSAWHEFLRSESYNGGDSHGFSELEAFSPADTNVTLAYEGHDVIIVTAEVSIVCALMIGVDETELCYADLRFGDDDRLMVWPDGTAAQGLPSCPITVNEIKLCGL